MSNPSEPKKPSDDFIRVQQRILQRGSKFRRGTAEEAAAMGMYVYVPSPAEVKAAQERKKRESGEQTT